MQAVIKPLGDHAITITLGNTIDESINEQVLALFCCIKEKNIKGVKDVIPAFASLTVVYEIVTIHNYDNTISAFEYIKREVEEVIKNCSFDISGKKELVHIPVCYHPSLAIDLEEMSKQKNISVEEITELHSSVIYRVYMIGFLPGFAYMGEVDAKIAMPRKSSPQSVSAGSVGVADRQTGIYPLNSPGGWNIIGKTPEPLFSKNYKDPCLLSPGVMVKFEPISLEEFRALK